MATVSIPNTSVQYNNPQQVPQATVLFSSGPTDLNNPNQVAGGVWTPNLSTVTSPAPGPTGLGWGFESYPKPDPLVLVPPPLASPVVFNADPIVLGKGQPVTVSGSAGSTGNPVVDTNRQVSGTIPNTNCTFRNPA